MAGSGDAGMRVVSLRRYPVKSMGGEDLREVRLDGRGLAGDRWFAVVDEDGRLASGKDSRRFRRRDAVLGYAARTSEGGVEVVRGPEQAWPVGDPSADAELTRACGAAVRLLPEDGTPHQDGGGVSLVGTATLAWCAERFGIDADPRRLRVNVVVETDEPFVEESWAGRLVSLGETALRVVEPVPRCRTVDLDQDGVVADGRWLQPLGAQRDACVAVYADVARPGTLRVGDVVVVEG